MIKLHTYPPCWGLSSLTPFGIKVEKFLQMNSLPYEIVVETNPRKGPMNKMPLIVDNGKTIADSSLILDYLKQTYQLTIDDNLNHKQRGIAHNVQTMLESHLYFIILYSRWIDPTGYTLIKSAFMPMFPPGLRTLAIAIIRRMLIKQGYQQGISRHDRDTIYQMGVDDLNALEALMASEGFFFGDKPHSIDACIYAFLITLQKTPIDTPLREAAFRARFQSYCHNPHWCQA